MKLKHLIKLATKIETFSVSFAAFGFDSGVKAEAGGPEGGHSENRMMKDQGGARWTREPVGA